MKTKTKKPVNTKAMRALYVQELKRLHKNLNDARKQLVDDQKDVAELTAEVAELVKLKGLAKMSDNRQALSEMLGDTRDNLAGAKEDLAFTKQDILDTQKKFDRLVG